MGPDFVYRMSWVCKGFTLGDIKHEFATGLGTK